MSLWDKLRGKGQKEEHVIPSAAAPRTPPVQNTLGTESQTPATIYDQGVRAWRQGQLTDEGFVEQLERVQEDPRQNPWLRGYFLALVHLERGAVDAAVPLLEEAVRQTPGEIELQKVLDLARGGGLGRSGFLRAFEGHHLGVNSVALGGNGQLALSGSDDKTLQLWEVATGRCLRTFRAHTGEVVCVSLSEDGHWALSGSSDKKVRLWEVATGRCLRTFEGHTNEVYAVSLSKDGGSALSGSRDYTLRLWEVATGRCLRTFAGHRLSVNSVSLSADGHWALSGSHDKTLRLWEVTTGRCLRTFEGHTAGVFSV
jgi:hypothetical protein